MKIALFTDTYKPQVNGVVAYISDAARELSKAHDVLLFAPGEGAFRVERVSRRFRICWVPSSPFPFYEGYRVAAVEYGKVSALLERERPDVVHAHAPVNLGLQGVVAAKRKGIPSVITYHTHFPDYVPHLMNGRLPRAFGKLSGYTVKRMVRHAFSMADVVTAPTHELAAELRSYGLKNVVCLPNGIDFSKLRCGAREVSAFRKAHGIGKGKKAVIYLGRISFEKRLDRLLEAFRMIERKDRVLMVAGGGPYLDKFRKFAELLGMKNVVFTGFVKNAGAAYRSAHVFASASDTETFGLTFVEAMHAGLPAVGVRRLGAKEVIRHNKNGLLVEPEDTEALARAMERLLEDGALRKRLADGAVRSSKAYSIKNSVGECVRIYRRLARGR